MAKWNISRLILIVMNHYGNRYIMSSVRPLSMVSSCLMKNNRDGDSRTSECKQDSCQEAFRMLELEELITIIPQQGVFVSGIKSRKEIDDIFRVRMVLEGLAAYLAALNINEEQRKKLKKYADQIEQCILDNDLKGCVKIDIAFHSIIKEASGNKWLERFLDSLFVQSTRFRMKSLSQEGRMVNALNEHRRLGEAITHGDADLAREYMEEHIRQAWKSILIVFEAEHPEE